MTFTNNMNQNMYLDILTNHLLPFGNSQYEEGQWIQGFIKITIRSMLQDYVEVFYKENEYYGYFNVYVRP